MNAPLFELSWLGGGAERAFRRRRPGVDELPWGTLDVADAPPVLLDRARLSWTDACFVEYVTATRLADIAAGLLRVRAPVDLVGLAGDFVADEMLHVELHARLLAELGGAVPYRAPAALLGSVPVGEGGPLRALAIEVVRTCCVGESLSVPLLAATRNAATHPLVSALLARIVEDEGPHAQLGWLFLDWADLTDGDRRALAEVARVELARATKQAGAPTSVVVDGVTREGFPLELVHRLGWLDSETWVAVTRASVGQIAARLARHGIEV